MNGLLAATQWLTIIPVRSRHKGDPVPFFSWVGLLFAALGASVGWLVRAAAPSSLGALLAGTLVVAAWAALSGMLHIDGLADTMDAIAGVRTDEERTAIMRDSRIGAHGAGALFLVLTACCVGCAGVVEAERWWVLATAPVVARFGVTIALGTLPPARTEGLAWSLAGHASAGGTIIAALPAILLALLCWTQAPLASIASVVAALVVPHALARRFGGLTGDLLGASIVLVEAVTLVAGCMRIGG